MCGEVCFGQGCGELYLPFHLLVNREEAGDGGSLVRRGKGEAIGSVG